MLREQVLEGIVPGSQKEGEIVGSGGGGSICALTSKEKEQQVLRAILKAGAKDAYAVAISSSQNSSYL